MISFAVKMIRYNEITELKDVGIVLPTPHPTEKELDPQRDQ